VIWSEAAWWYKHLVASTEEQFTRNRFYPWDSFLVQFLGAKRALCGADWWLLASKGEKLKLPD
jgi:hypothetical protein